MICRTSSAVSCALADEPEQRATRRRASAVGPGRKGENVQLPTLNIQRSTGREERIASPARFRKIIRSSCSNGSGGRQGKTFGVKFAKRIQIPAFFASDAAQEEPRNVLALLFSWTLNVGR